MSEGQVAAATKRQAPAGLSVWIAVAAGVTLGAVIAWYGLVHELPKIDGELQLERNSVRSATLAAIAAVGAAVGLFISARTHLHTVREAAALADRHRQDIDSREELATKQRLAEQSRADRLHVTQLFDSAADKLGAEDDATRTAGVLILERVYDDARALLEHQTAAAGGATPVDSLRRSIIETLCGYIRERSRVHSDAWHTEHGQAKSPATHDTGLSEQYQSPASIRTALAILGRLAPPPEGVIYDISASHLAGVAITGTVHAGLQAQRSLIGRNAIFSAAYKKEVSFSGATFTGDAQFSGATITGGVGFTDVTISGDAWFINVTTTRSASFTDATITGVAWFVDATFARGAWFNGATFTGDAQFNGATITGGARFADATFTSGAWFTGATITDKARFTDATFTSDAWFTDATIGGDAWFTNATISGDAWFEGATISGNTSFNRATITGDARFAGATIGSRRSVNINLGAAWRGRVTGLETVQVPSLRTDIHFGRASFAFAADDPRNWLY